MSNLGYVYVLINPSIQGMVKVGKTTRDVEQRIAELSNQTSVPTPFMLVYKELFDNCHTAEQEIHFILEQQGYRVSNNREFFNAPIDHVIRTIQSYKNMNDSEEKQNIEVFPEEIKLGMEMMEEGLKYYLGDEQNIQDYSEALKWFKKSARLRIKEAYKYMGKIYLYGDCNIKKNKEKAIEYFKEGMQAGDFRCLAELGIIYTIHHFDQESIKYGMQYWKLYFNRVNIDKLIRDDVVYCKIYIGVVAREKIEFENNKIISLLKDNIIEEYKDDLEIYKNDYSLDYREFHIERIEDSIAYIYANVDDLSLEERRTYNNRFRMKIYGKFEVNGLAVLCGEIESGEVRVNQVVSVENDYMKKNFRVYGIEESRKMVEVARMGSSIGLVIETDLKEIEYLNSKNDFVIG